MEDFQYSWVANDHSFSSKSPSFSSPSYGTHSSSRLLREEDTSFNSLESTASTRNIPYNFSQNSVNYHQFVKPSISHFCIGSLKTLTPQISCVAVHSDYIYAATINEIQVFGLRSYELVETFGSGLGLVKSIAFSDKKIFTAHQDCKIRVWQHVVTSSSKQKAHKLITTLPTLKDRVFNCPLAKHYVQVRRHKKKLWIEHADTVSGLAVNNNIDAGLMYSVSWDKSFKIWKTSSDMRCLESIKAHSDAVNAVVANPFDNTIYTGSADGSIKVWNKSGDSKKHLLLATLEEHESSVNALALMRDGSVLCSGGGDKVILVWERRDGCENTHQMFVSCCLKGHRGSILCLAHLNGVLISGSSDKTVRIWRYDEKDIAGCLAVLEGHSKPVKSLAAVCADEDDKLDENLSVFSGGLDGEIRVWKVVISDHREY